MASSELPQLEARVQSGNSAAPAGGADCDVVAVFQDTGKKALSPRGAYAGHVDKLRKGEAFSAAHGGAQFVRFGGKAADSVLFVGLGTAAELTEERARQAGGAAWARLSAEKSRTAAIHVDSLFEVKGLKADIQPARLVRAFAEGLALSAYSFTKHKTAAQPAYRGPSKIIFLTAEKSIKAQLDPELKRILSTAAAVNVTRDWSNEPSNYGTAEYFAAEARKLGKSHGLKVRILTEADAKREKMGLFLAVGQGSEREGRLVVVEYSPKGVKNPKTLAFVGKGVTFDTGGISIKPSMRMEEMKHDMTGAATVMGAVLLAAEWKVPNRVVGIMAFTENMPDGDAIVPGCVITSRAGKTVEIINTDAEGRLILADALDFAHDFKPDAIVDIATLTGAVTIALGKHCCAVLGNDEGLIDAVRRAGDANGERVWQLPLFDEYFEDLKSDTADMRNSANDSYGGTIRGAIFLKQFIRKGMPWAHLDIAATSTGLGHLSYYPKRGANGSYVRTLAQLAADF